MTLVTPINHNDPRVQAAVAAEKQMFAYYELDYQVHSVEMSDPGLRLRVYDVGEGEPLLIVPGGTGDAIFMVPLMAEIRGYRMIAINRPGGGMSDGIDHRKIDVRRLAVKTIQTVADAIGLDQVPIVSNSMGGLWSFWFTLEHPQRVSRLVQMGCPALLLNTSAPFMMRLLGVPGINRLIAPNMQPKDAQSALGGLRFQGSSQEDIDRMPAVGAEAAYRFFNLPTYIDSWKTLVSAVATFGGANPRYQFQAEQLQQVQCPVQFIWGENDPFGGLDVAREATRLTPQATLHEMQTGHLPFLDKPQETGRVVQAFLDQMSVKMQKEQVP